MIISKPKGSRVRGKDESPSSSIDFRGRGNSIDGIVIPSVVFTDIPSTPEKVEVFPNVSFEVDFQSGPSNTLEDKFDTTSTVPKITNVESSQSEAKGGNTKERKKQRLLKKQLISIQRQLRERSEMRSDPTTPVIHFSSGSYFTKMGNKASGSFPILPQRTNSLWGNAENPDMLSLHLQVEELLKQEQEDEASTDVQLGHNDYIELKPPEHDHLFENTQEVDVLVREDMKDSKKSKLKDLSSFVSSHTGRKLLDSWNEIHVKFEASQMNTYKKVGEEMVALKSLCTSDLILLLCSPRIKIKLSEFSSMCADFKISRSVIEHARKVAAVKLMIHLNEIDPNYSIKKASQLSVRMQVLMRTTEILVSIEQIKNWCFPKDADGIARVMAKIEADKQAQLLENIQEKKKSKEIAERSEARLLKATMDYKNAKNELQYSKGPLSLTRLYALQSVFEFCTAVLKEASAEKMLVVPIEVMDLIGRDVFPEVVVRASLDQQEHRGALLLNKSNKDKKPIPTTFCDGNSRVLLQGPPAPFLKMIWETAVVLGKGLNGFSYRDIFELLQAYAATRMQSVIRGNKMRKRYKFLKRLRQKVSGEVKRRNFVAFKELTRRNVDQRIYCWRKIKVWRSYTKSLIKIHDFFRTSFWPFYVWRRWACANRTAKEKAKFLVSRVYPAYLQIKVYNAWYRYTHLQATRKKIADNFVKDRLFKKATTLFKFYHKWARHKKLVRRRWLKEGILKLQRAVEHCKIFPLIVWKTYLYYKKCVNLRVRASASSFRDLLFKGAPAYSPPTITQIREACKKATADRELAELAAIAERKNSLSFDDTVDDDHNNSANSQTAPFIGNEEEEVYFWPKKLPKRKTYILSVDIDYENDLVIHEKKSLDNLLTTAIDTEVTPGSPPVFTPSPAMINVNRNKVVYFVEKKKQSVIDKTYNLGFDNMIEADDIEYISICEEFIRNKCAVLRLRAVEAEKMSLLEVSFRYHRNMRRVFRHLKHNAIISRNAFNSQTFYRLKKMKTVFDGFVRWMNRGSMNDPNAKDYIADTGMSKAETLSIELRVMRLKKMHRRKDLIEALKARGDDTDDLDERGNKILKKIEPKQNSSIESKSTTVVANPIVTAPDEISILTTDSKGSKGSKSKKRKDIAKKAIVEAVAPVVHKEHVPIPTDMLLYDRADRDEESSHVQKILELSTELIAEEAAHVVAADIVTAKMNRIKLLSQNYLDDICQAEDRITENAIDHELMYAEEFKKWAADAMLELLVKVNREVRVMLSKSVLKRCFRYLRMPILIKISKSMFSRKRMSNLVRIGKRFEYINQNIDKYSIVRKKWIIFNRWLKYIELEMLNSTKGLSTDVSRRNFLRQGLHRELQSLGFMPIVYYNSRRLMFETCCLNVTFYRLLSYAQETIVFRRLDAKFVQFYNIRLMHRCFLALKTLRSFSEIYEMQKKDPSFAEIRVLSDVHQYLKRFVSKRKRSIPYVIKRLSAVFMKKQIQSARKGTSFKNFITSFKRDIAARLVAEQRILVDAFGLRGRMDFKDFLAPNLLSHQSIPGVMGNAEGNLFCDPPIRQAEDITGKSDVPGGYKIVKIRLNLIDGMGIVGWQLFWAADGAKEIESPKRGKWLGAGFKREEINISIDDFILGLEYYYEGSAMFGLRLRLMLGGWTHWVGGRASPSTLTCHLGIELADYSNTEEGMHIAHGEDQLKNRGFPLAYVTGFSGIENANRATCIRLLVRKVISQNIFSYNWVQEGIAIEAKQRLEDILSQTEEADDTSSVGEGSMNDESSLPSLSSTSKSSLRDELKRKKKSKKKKEETKIHQITESEEQFFDVIRMRLTEVRAAEKRVLSLARLLWNSAIFRQESHPYHSFSKITNLNGLCRWYFESICKRLVGVPKFEKSAFEMIEKSRGIKLRGEIQYRRGVALSSTVKKALAAKHPWDGKPILGPHDRELKTAFMAKIEKMDEEADQLTNEGIQFHVEAEKMYKEGRALLPQLELSRFVCKNYRRKLEASKTKMSLLSVMDMGQLKNTLMGAGKDVSLSEFTMNAVKEAMALNGFRNDDDDEWNSKKVPTLADAVNDIMRQNMYEDAFSAGSTSVLNKSFRSSFAVNAPHIVVNRKGLDQVDKLKPSKKAAAAAAASSAVRANSGSVPHRSGSPSSRNKNRHHLPKESSLTLTLHSASVSSWQSQSIMDLD